MFKFCYKDKPTEIYTVLESKIVSDLEIMLFCIKNVDNTFHLLKFHSLCLDDIQFINDKYKM